MSELERVDLKDFTGGLNIREGEFQISDNESPEMLNMEVDPRAGFFTRSGWVRWNATDIMTPASWDPRNAELHDLSTGSSQTYVTTKDSGVDEGQTYAAGPDAIFADISVVGNAFPHLVDFAFWGDIAYMATGHNAASDASSPFKRTSAAAAVALLDASLGFNDDYTTPTYGRFPFADFAEPHASYMFCAYTEEQDGGHPNRLRWSHPDNPEDWATLDFIDVAIGGGRITGLRSFQDHLLIFKTDSVWALYGYDLDSWQLIKISRSLGVPTTTAIARSENAVFIYSTSGGGGVYSYDGERIQEMSLPLRPAMEAITAHDDVWVAWVGQRLWCSVPWAYESLAGVDAGVFVFDYDVGDGAWVFHQPALGTLRCIVERSDLHVPTALGVMHGDSGAACLVLLESDKDHARDTILETGAETAFDTFYRTNWKDADWPDRLKSWLRPRWVAQRPDLDVSVRLDIYKDYESNNPARTSQGLLTSGGSILWTALGFADPSGQGFDFKELGAADPSGEGADFTEGAQGAALGRAVAGFGPARAIQIKLSNTTTGDDSGLPWGFDAIFLKTRLRRFTT